jgi:hypothetical protein
MLDACWTRDVNTHDVRRAIAHMCWRLPHAYEELGNEHLQAQSTNAISMNKDLNSMNRTTSRSSEAINVAGQAIDAMEEGVEEELLSVRVLHAKSAVAVRQRVQRADGRCRRRR